MLDLDFALEPGEFCLLLGENGAGKSTFFRCLLDLENFSGEVEIGDRTSRASIFGILDQPMMYAGWTVAKNLRYLLNDRRADTRPVVAQLVDSSILRKRVGRLSTGQKKIALLAAALAGDARIVLLDEFANGLDQRARGIFRNAVRNELAEGRSFIVTGHDLHAFGDLATRVVVMCGGRLAEVAASEIAQYTVQEIYERHVG